MKTIVEILIFGIVFGAFGALIYHLVLWGKRKNNK
jgi:O-antigen/teichoic acid export membrane protein